MSQKCWCLAPKGFNAVNDIILNKKHISSNDELLSRNEADVMKLAKISSQNVFRKKDFLIFLEPRLGISKS